MWALAVLAETRCSVNKAVQIATKESMQTGRLDLPVVLCMLLIKAGRHLFKAFLRSEYSEENMMFWMACEELKHETVADIIEEKARTIYDDYISILSPKEVRRSNII